MQESRDMSAVFSTLVGSGAGGKNRRAKLVQPRPSIPGAFPDRTVLANFHSTSQRSHTVVAEFRCMCRISIADRFKFIINETPDPNLVFPASIRNPVTAKRSPNAAFENIYKIDEVWITVEDQHMPLLADLDSFTDKTVDCTTRFLSGSIGTAYENNTTALYNVTFQRVAVSPMFVGTFAAAPARQDNSPTLCTTSIKTRFISSPTVPFPTAVYLCMMRQDTESGRWVNYIPQVQDHETPLITGVPQRKCHPVTKQYVTGELSYGPVTTDGYVEYIVRDLPTDSKFACFISDVSNMSDFIALVKVGDMTSDYFLEQAARIPQPEAPCTFCTPLSYSSDEDIVVNAFSCVDGLLTALKSWKTMPACHFKAIIGDNYYQDSSVTRKDFMDHYESLARNPYWKAMEIDGGCVHMFNDHEVGDNWNSVIVTTAGNGAQFQLTPDEVILYNQMISKPENSKYIVFKRLANDGLKTVYKNSTIHDALSAFHQALPTMPPNKNHSTLNWHERWGRLLTIFANGEPMINEDGSVEYWKRRARVTENPDGTQIIDYVPEVPGGEPINQFIPRPTMEYIKNTLIADKQLNGRQEAMATYIFFGGNVKPNYSPEQRSAFLSKFIEMAKEVETGENVEQKATNLFNKLWVQRRADKSDLAASPDILELVQWFKVNKIKNVFFVTGDPHNSTGNYLDKDNVIVELCLSTVGNYRSNSITAAFLGKPDDENAIFNVSDCNWGNLTLDVKEREIVARVAGEEGLYAMATIPLAR